MATWNTRRAALSRIASVWRARSIVTTVALTPGADRPRTRSFRNTCTVREDHSRILPNIGYTSPNISLSKTK